MTQSSTTARRWALPAFAALAGAGVGFFSAREIIGLARTVELGWADLVSLFLAVALIAQGVFVLLLSFNRDLAGRAFGGPEPRPATPAQLSFYRQQAGVVLLAGLMLAAPVLTTLLTEAPMPRELALIVMATIVAAFAMQTFLNIVVWRRADEFMRRLIAETSSVCFWILQAALFLWAAGERLALLPAVDAWSAVTVMMSVYFCASAFISLRNGVGT